MSTSQSPQAPLLELAAARIEMHDVAVADGMSLRLTGPRVVIVGDPTPLFAPLFGSGTVMRGWFKVMGNDLNAIRPSLGLAPLDPPLPPSWTPIEYVVWSAKLAGMSSGDALVAALRWCDRVGLGSSSRSKIEKLPTVPRRLTMLAQAAVASPRLLVIDNPLWRLTPDEAHHLLAAMGQLSGEGGCANVLVSTTRFEPGSPGDILARGADELVLIVDGEVIEQGTPSMLAQQAEGDIMPTNTTPDTTSQPPADSAAIVPEASTGTVESADLPTPPASTDVPPKHAPTENSTGENAQIDHNGNVDGPGTHGRHHVVDVMDGADKRES